jgi:hypothetical protein
VQFVDDALQHPLDDLLAVALRGDYLVNVGEERSDGCLAGKRRGLVFSLQEGTSRVELGFEFSAASFGFASSLLR